jgi:cell division transport system ATP-binding protein
LNPETRPPYIEFQDVEVHYTPHVHGLRGITLSIRRGDFVFFVGKTGAGKSTLLKLLTREVHHDAGIVRFHGRDLGQVRERDVPALRREMGIVPQDFALLPRKRVWENVAYAMRAVGNSRRTVRRRVPEILERVNVGHRADAFPNELSGGEQQRVAIGRALINNPPLILADEPTGNLDPQHSWEIMELLRSLNARGATVLVATHDMAVVERMARRIVTLEGGRIVDDTAPDGLIVPLPIQHELELDHHPFDPQRNREYLPPVRSNRAAMPTPASERDSHSETPPDLRSAPHETPDTSKATYTVVGVSIEAEMIEFAPSQPQAEHLSEPAPNPEEIAPQPIAPQPIALEPEREEAWNQAISAALAVTEAPPEPPAEPAPIPRIEPAPETETESQSVSTKEQQLQAVEEPKPLNLQPAEPTLSEDVETQEGAATATEIAGPQQSKVLISLPQKQEETDLTAPVLVPNASGTVTLKPAQKAVSPFASTKPPEPVGAMTETTAEPETELEVAVPVAVEAASSPRATTKKPRVKTAKATKSEESDV